MGPTKQMWMVLSLAQETLVELEAFFVIMREGYFFTLLSMFTDYDIHMKILAIRQGFLTAVVSQRVNRQLLLLRLTLPTSFLGLSTLLKHLGDSITFLGNVSLFSLVIFTGPLCIFDAQETR